MLCKPKHIAPLIVSALLMMAAIGCSTQKNTAKTRWWHSFNARYNTYYNGSQAYIDGSLEKETGNKDNFTEIIPLYTVGNKNSRELGKGNFDRAIEKCQKAIKLHSIKRKPQWTKHRRKTEKDIEWLTRREYNPFLWKAWLLMGRSQFHKGAFDEAASTFSYMSRLYQSQPAIYGRARAWLAKCYIEQDWMYDAEDVIRNMQRDSVAWQAQKEWDYTMADYYIHTADYKQAVPYLRKVIKHEMRRKQKAREWFLMGQLQAALGNKQEAMKAYKHVVKQNPPYEVEFNARIAMTEVMSAGQSKKMIRRLKRMAASDKNKEYLDQVYYAIGNIYLAEKDTLHAISSYESGNTKATRSGIEKGVLLLKLGDLYWDKERFNDAQRCYGEAIGLLDKERKDYEQLSRRSKILDELVPHTDAVHLQDSLQELAKMDEKSRNAAIDRVIEALKKKEKEERDRLAEQEAQEAMAKNGGSNTLQNNRTNTTTANQKKGESVWYFYNPTAVSQGKATFQQQWGKRENVDNWQRVNKTVVDFGSASDNMTDEQRDSIAAAEALQDSLAQVTDSAQNDPHKREYYLAQIPFTEDQLQASNLLLEDGLYHSGVIFKDKFDNLPLSEKALRRLSDNYPDFERMADVYYHLFLLYSRKGETAIADSYVDKLKEKYPDNAWTTLLTDPHFVENAKFGEHMEDSLYAATYTAFKNGRNGEVRGNVHVSDTRFPLGANRDKFIFIGGLGKLNSGDAEGCLADMNTVVQKYPQSRLSEMAGMIINGVKAGKKLRGGKFDIGDVWQRRSAVMADSDSVAAKTLLPDRNVDFVFIIAYQPDSVNENQLLYELARYNFTNFLARNFDIEIEDAEGVRLMKISGFRNYDEALQYARQFHQQAGIAERIGNSRTIIISQQNLPLLGQQFSYDDYDAFYAKHFAPLKVSTLQLLTEPSDVVVKQADNAPLTPEDIDKALDEGTYFDNGLEAEPADNASTVISEEQPAAPGATQDDGTVVPERQSEAPEVEPAGETVVPDVQQTAEPAGETVIPDLPSTPQTAGEQGETVIPLDEKSEGSSNAGSTVIPVEPSSKPSAATPALPKTSPTQAPAAKPSGSSANPTSPVPAAKAAQTAPVQTTPAKKQEDEFYFDEDEKQPSAKQPASTSKQPTSTSKQPAPSTKQPAAPTKAKSTDTNKKVEPTTADDDEYYDLDGF